jgi:hypothetical protein
VYILYISLCEEKLPLGCQQTREIRILCHPATPEPINIQSSNDNVLSNMLLLGYHYYVFTTKNAICVRSCTLVAFSAVQGSLETKSLVFAILLVSFDSCELGLFCQPRTTVLATGMDPTHKLLHNTIQSLTIERLHHAPRTLRGI